jgi:hypothetical protein
MRVHGGQFVVTLAGVACLAAAAFLLAHVSARAFWAFAATLTTAFVCALAVTFSRAVRDVQPARTPRR